MGSLFINLIKAPFVLLIRMICTAPMATIVWLICAVGGLLATGTWIGTTIAWVIGLFWWWVPYVALIVGVACIAWDVAEDGTAQRRAMYLTLTVPSVGMAIPKDAKLYGLLHGWIVWLNHWLDHHIGPWIGNTGQRAVMTVVACTAIGLAVLYNEVHGKNRGGASRMPVGAGAGGGMAAGRRA